MAKKKDNDFIFITVILVAIVAIAWVIANFDNIVTFFSPADPEIDEDYIVAEVDGTEISLGALNRRYYYLKAQFGPQIMKEIARNTTIDELLFLNEALRQNITIDEGKFEDKVSEYISQNSEKARSTILKEYNISVAEWETDVRDALYRQDMILRLINKTILSRYDSKEFEITEEDIRAYYEENKDSLESIELKRILVCFEGAYNCNSTRKQEDALKIVNDIYEKLLLGETFTDLVKEYSEDSIAEPDGTIPPVSPNDLDDTLKAVIGKLKYPGQFSEPFQDDDGYQIILFENRLDTLEELKNRVMIEISFKKQIEDQMSTEEEKRAAIREYLAELRKKADIELFIIPEEIDTSFFRDTGDIGTFRELLQAEVCTENGKPVIRMFSTTGCPHCRWAKDLFDDTMIEYGDRIVAYHWEMDENDNTLTDQVEGTIPDPEKDLYLKFNPGRSVPTFIFGCKYYRIGTGYEGSKNAEEREMAEYRMLIDKLLA